MEWSHEDLGRPSRPDARAERARLPRARLRQRPRQGRSLRRAGQHGPLGRRPARGWSHLDRSRPLPAQPRVRRGDGDVDDGAGASVVLFVGAGVAAARWDDVWEWDGATGVWAGPFTPTPRPSARTGHALAYDSARGKVVLF